MTVMVYDPSTDRFLVDSLIETSSCSKDTRYVVLSKVKTSAEGHKFAASGTVDESVVGLLVDDALRETVPRALKLLALDASATTIFVRHKDGRAFISNRHGDGLVLSPYYLNVPFSCAGGGYFFDAYYAEHGSVDKAMALTCAHAIGCGLPVATF